MSEFWIGFLWGIGATVLAEVLLFIVVFIVGVLNTDFSK